MEVIMSSPVNELSMTENAESNGSVKLNKSQKKNQRRKLKLQLLKSLAKNHENNQQLHQSNPNSSPITTATVDLKQEVSSPVADDTNTCPETELHMVTHNEEMISDNTIATSDVKTLSKEEEDTEASNGMTATDNTVSKKKKRPKKKKKKNPASSDIQSVDESTQTQDIVTEINNGSSKAATSNASAISKVEDDSKVSNGEIGPGTTVTDNTVSEKRRNPESSDIQSLEESTQTQDMVTVINIDSTETSGMENDGSNGAVELTKTQKINRKKRQKIRELKSYVKNLENKQQLDQKKQEESSPATTIGADTQPEAENHMVTHSKTMILSEIATSDANSVLKGEDYTQVADGEICPDNSVPEKRMNPESSDIQSVDESTQIQEIVTVINKDSSYDANVVVKGVDDTEVVNGEVSLVTTATDDNTVSKKKKKPNKILKIKELKSYIKDLENKLQLGQKQAESSPAIDDTSTCPEVENHIHIKTMILAEIATSDDAKSVSKEKDDSKVATDSTVSKKRKNPESSDIQSVDDSTKTQDMATLINIDSIETSGMENDGSNGGVKLTKTQKHNLKKRQELKFLKSYVKDLVNKLQLVQNQVESSPVTIGETMMLSEIAISDAKSVSKVEEGTQVVNGEICPGTTATDNTVSKKRKRPKKKEKNPASSDIQSVDESTKTQDMATVINIDSSETSRMDDAATIGPVKLTKTQKNNLKLKMELKFLKSYVKELENKQQLDQSKSTGEEDTKVTNGEISLVKTATEDNTLSKKKKKPTKVQKLKLLKSYVKNLENKQQLVQNNPNNNIAISDANTGTQRILDKTSNGEMDLSTTTTIDNTRIKNVLADTEMYRSTYRRLASLGENLNPQFVSKKRKRNDLDIDGQTEVKPKDDEIHGVAVLGKKLIIFDVNGLLADIIFSPPNYIKADKYITNRAIFKRPFMEDFLRFCFERFNVGIWSSRTKPVLDPVVDFLLGDLKKNLLFVWDASSCTKTGMNTFEDKFKPMVFKDLRKIWEKNGYGNSWVKGDFHESNTLLVDDSPYKALINPKNTAIFPQSYSYKDRNDDLLGPYGDLRKYLEDLAESEDVKKYVEQHPFGQRPIDETHQHWAFYSQAFRVINSTC